MACDSVRRACCAMRRNIALNSHHQSAGLWRCKSSRRSGVECKSRHECRRRLYFRAGLRLGDQTDLRAAAHDDPGGWFLVGRRQHWRCRRFDRHALRRLARQHQLQPDLRARAAQLADERLRPSQCQGRCHATVARRAVPEFFRLRLVGEEFHRNRWAGAKLFFRRHQQRLDRHQRLAAPAHHPSDQRLGMRRNHFRAHVWPGQLPV